MSDPSNIARLLESVELLRRHNVWRRGEDYTAEMISPGLVGAAIDTIVELVPQVVDDIDMLEKAFSLLRYNPPPHIDCSFGLCGGCQWASFKKRLADRLLS